MEDWDELQESLWHLCQQHDDDDHHHHYPHAIVRKYELISYENPNNNGNHG